MTALKVIPLLAALAVALCHPACAWARRPAATREARAAVPPCHRHPTPEREGPREDGCPHCNRPTTAVDGRAVAPEAFKPAEALPVLAVLPRFIACDGLTPSDHARVLAGDLSPPGAGQTLLGLHCALNT
jgi:hypothetical protein